MHVKGNSSEFMMMQLKKVGVIEDKYKTRVLNLYLSRENLLHTVRFLTWLLAIRPEKYSDPEIVSDNFFNFLELGDAGQH